MVRAVLVPPKCVSGIGEWSIVFQDRRTVEVHFTVSAFATLKSYQRLCDFRAFEQVHCTGRSSARPFLRGYVEVTFDLNAPLLGITAMKD
jgi:hypothetical protein